ncbi:type VI secretion system baseplate subunit TssE [Escherichia coli]|uniref:type VI secretion system baseplate subunit TssE n=1 Tax=Escherichia coli TaxID=562 RepID=UPI001D308302|nr:type VI secretion system baseplate subunit TssE [Escherichia coli]MBW1514041.1 type VI secretion protein [Escherichia coli]MDF8382769.1 type VI secretion system baseplate subunit TssE [Escherichia coli]
MIPDRERTTGSLFERMEASSARNRQGGSIHSLRQSIRQNLRNILNTRSGSCRGAPELGIDEPEGAENFRESMSRAIEQCIERYEPRISHAEVQAVVSSASSPLDMTFHITAWVTFNGKRLVRTVLIFTESSDQLSRATDRVPGLPASPGYVQ